ncbi:uncharacterized protein TRUGW13939_04189 [Talaromyces rugulosus]|uniref:Uncharacterized protein n=1 Tax=Talaromyces rugulosus TaxID=121627 RepID=A0A7H8QU87_TALRU|nr:uncharacterized protein TRUGW13939_04189 [Talaromyces rugulosus]QKX57081.1 hypothetical protein TRUGW13939_04189 [Talaromyces rugulosus]
MNSTSFSLLSEALQFVVCCLLSAVPPCHADKKQQIQGLTRMRQSNRWSSLSSANLFTVFFVFLPCLPLTYAESCATALLKTIATRWDSLGSDYQTEICARGCQPVISTWDDWTRAHAFLPLIDTMAREMSLSDNFKQTFTGIGEDIAKATKEECDGLLGPGQHFCTSGSDNLDQWNYCFKKQAAKVAASNMFTMFRLVSGEICKEERYKYLSDDQLWKVVLPQYMRKYGDTCQLGKGAQKKTTVLGTPDGDQDFLARLRAESAPSPPKSGAKRDTRDEL